MFEKRILGLIRVGAKWRIGAVLRRHRSSPPILSLLKSSWHLAAVGALRRDLDGRTLMERMVGGMRL